MAVVGEDDTAHGVEEHLEHGLGAEAGSDDISDTTRRGGRSVRVHGGVKGGLCDPLLGGCLGTVRFGGGDVGHLSLAASLPLTTVGICKGTR